MCKIAFCGKHEKLDNMDVLFEKQEVMLRSTDMKIVRDFMRTVNWTAPLLCIRGARGVGKSTLLRQYIKQNNQFLNYMIRLACLLVAFYSIQVWKYAN